VEPLKSRPSVRGSILYPVRPVSHSPHATEMQPRQPCIRRHVGVTDHGPDVLFCGRLIESTQLLPATQWWVREESPGSLRIAWVERRRTDIETAREHLSLTRVCVVGFVNESDLPAPCTAADVFLLPSALHGTWDLVVKEAVTFSLPMVLSYTVGCVDDLVLRNWNGFTVPHRSGEELASTRCTPMGDASLWRMFGEPNRCMTDDCTIQRCAAGIVAARLSTVAAA
jgi:glycosyltransferase involved in cell wall biosynthesis